MIYAKFIDDKTIEELSKNYVIWNGRVYTNPSQHVDKPLDKLGYKELIVDDMPSYDNENQKLVMYYVEDVNAIVRKWKIETLTEEEIEMMSNMSN